MDTKREHLSEANELAKRRRFAQLAPQDPDVHLALARELLANSELEEAALELHTVIALAPNHLEARKLLDQVTRDF